MLVVTSVYILKTTIQSSRHVINSQNQIRPVTEVQASAPTVKPKTVLEPTNYGGVYLGPDSQIEDVQADVWLGGQWKQGSSDDQGDDAASDVVDGSESSDNSINVLNVLEVAIEDPEHQKMESLPQQSTSKNV